MATDVNRLTDVLTVPQTDLTFVSGTLYEQDTRAFWEELKAIEASEEGIVWPDFQEHESQTTVAGVTYAEFIIMLAPYTVTFEDGQYAALLSGSNNNIFDEGIINRNQVSIVPTNSAGLIVGSDVTASGLAVAVWDRLLATHGTSGSAGETLRTLEKIFTNDAVVQFNGGTGENEVTIYDDDGTTVLRQMSVTTDGLTRTVLVGS